MTKKGCPKGLVYEDESIDWSHLEYDEYSEGDYVYMYSGRHDGGRPCPPLKCLKPFFGAMWGYYKIGILDHQCGTDNQMIKFVVKRRDVGNGRKISENVLPDVPQITYLGLYVDTVLLYRDIR